MTVYQKIMPTTCSVSGFENTLNTIEKNKIQSPFSNDLIEKKVSKTFYK